MAIVQAEKRDLKEVVSVQQTRQLYVCNVGASCGVTYEEAHALLSPVGEIHRLMLIGLSPFAIVEYTSVEAAVGAPAVLDGTEWHAPSALKSRPVFMEFAQVDQSVFLSNEPHALQLPNAVLLSTLSPQSVCTVLGSWWTQTSWLVG
jgi:hypothetical protein